MNRRSGTNGGVAHSTTGKHRKAYSGKTSDEGLPVAGASSEQRLKAQFTGSPVPWPVSTICIVCRGPGLPQRQMLSSRRTSAPRAENTQPLRSGRRRTALVPPLERFALTEGCG